jgi:hypothetical protein
MIKDKQRNTDYIFIILLILNGGTIIKILGFTAITQFATVFLMFFLLLNNGKILIKGTTRAIVFFIFSFLLISFFHFYEFNLDTFFSNQVINFCCLILMAVFFGNQFLNRNISLILKLDKSLKILIIHGIISCLIISLFPTNNILFESIDGQSAYVGYANIFFQRTNIIYTGDLSQVMQTILGFNFYRAHGIFWESGVLATYINIYVFINLFTLKNIKSLRIAILGHLLCWSTSGLFVFMILAIVFLYNYRKDKKQNVFYSYLLVLTAILLMIIPFIDNYNNKMSGKDMGSAAQRFSDTMGAYNVIQNNPIIGIGVDFKTFEKQLSNATVDFSSELGSRFESANKDSVQYSNSFLRIFIYFGVVIGLILLYALYRQTLIPNKKWLFLLITVLSVASVPLFFLGFHFTIMMSGLRDMIFKPEGKKLK